MLVGTLLWLGGLLIGGAGVWLWVRSSTAVLRSRLEASEHGQESAEGAAVAMRDELRKAQVREAELQERAKGDAEKLSWVERARQEMGDTFAALASKALQDNTALATTDAREKIVRPLEATLTKLDAQVRDLESKRAGAYGEMLTQLQEVQRANTELTRSTTTLSQALQSSSVRGRWGEMQLRRVAELAGLARHIDFSEQAQSGGERPDMVVHLPGGGSLPVDAKAPMSAFLASVDAPDVDIRRAKLDEHVKAVLSRIRELGGKQYWRQFEKAPEFVVMFIPIEAALSAAFNHDPELLEKAIEQRVLLATPVTLLALLRTIAFGWQQQQATENFKEIQRQNRELYERLIPWLEHEKEIGTKLDAAVKAYNSGIGSLHGRVLPAAEKLKELGVSSDGLPALQQVEQQIRTT